MNKQPAMILSGVSCALAGICLFQVKSLQTQLDDLRSQNAQYYSQLQSGISDISSSVSAQLEQQQSLLAQTDHTYGAVNAETGTIALHYTLVPKEYTPGVTRATLQIGDASAAMEYENGVYSAVIDLPIFAESADGIVTLQDGNTLRTQALNEYFSPQYQAIPDIYIARTGSTEYSTSDGVLTVTEKQPLIFTFDANDPPDIQSITLTAELNGAEIDRIPVDLSQSGQADLANNKLWQDSSDFPDIFSTDTYCAVLEQEYQVPAGQNLRIYADVELKNGLLCRMLTDAADADENGNAFDSSDDDVMYFFGRPRYVYYAPTHKLLWDAVLGEANSN